MKKFSSTSVSNETGFTLLEILIAVVLLAFITFGVVSVTENAINTKERTTETNKNNLQIETAMSRFEWDFSQIYSPLYFSTIMNLNANQNLGNPAGEEGNLGGVPANNQGGPAGTQNGGIQSPELQQYYEQLVQRYERNEHFSSVSKEGQPVPRFSSPDKNTFEFFTSSNRRKKENQKQSHFAWVRYGLVEQEQTEAEEENPAIPKSLKSFVRYFSADDPYSDKKIDIAGDGSESKAAVLLRNVESLEFQFWDLQKRKWETNLRTVPQGENLIRGVRLLVTWYDSTGAKRSTTRIFRTHWPLVTPQDQPTAPVPEAEGTAGATAGTQAAANAGAQGGVQ